MRGVLLCQEFGKSKSGSYKDGECGADFWDALSSSNTGVSFSAPFLECLALLETFLFSVKCGIEVCTWWQALGKTAMLLGRGCIVLWMAFSIVFRIRGMPCAFLAAKMVTHTFLKTFI